MQEISPVSSCFAVFCLIQAMLGGRELEKYLAFLPGFGTEEYTTKFLC